MSGILNAPETWVSLSLLIFFGILGYFGVHRIVVGALDKRADGIRARIVEARDLREAASDQVKRHQEELENAARDAEAVIEQARRDANSAREAALVDFRATLERRVAAAEERIRQAEIAAKKDIRNHAIDIAVAAAAEIIEKGLSAEDRKAEAKDGIEAIRNRLN